MSTAAMTEAKITLDKVKDSITFADKICSQCNLCFRTPNDPDIFCWPKFVGNRMDFIEEFVLRIISDRRDGKDVNKYRLKKTWRELFCHTKKGICKQKGKCNKRKKKRCYRRFSEQVINLEMENPYSYRQKAQQSTVKKKKGKKKKKKGQKVHGVHDDSWWQDEAYGYVGGGKDLPDVTVIGKKKFQNEVDKILDEDTDQ
jgi:hypothetical protein